MAKRPDSDDDDLHIAIGRLVRNWSEIEFLLDMLTFELFTNHGGNGIENVLPYALNRKLKFLKSCTKELDSLRAFHGATIKTTKAIAKAAEKRHIIVHSRITRPRSDVAVYDFERHESSQERRVIHESYITPKVVHLAADSLLPARGTLIAMLVITNVSKELLNDLERKLAREIAGLLVFYKETGDVCAKRLEDYVASCPWLFNRSRDGIQ